MPTGRERSREDVVAEVLNGSSGYAINGCRTVANGVQKCDVPSVSQRDTALAKAPTKAVEAH